MSRNNGQRAFPGSSPEQDSLTHNGAILWGEVTSHSSTNNALLTNLRSRLPLGRFSATKGSAGKRWPDLVSQNVKPLIAWIQCLRVVAENGRLSLPIRILLMVWITPQGVGQTR